VSLAFIAEMELEGPVIYSCPMHPEVVSDVEGSCPQCGMKLVPTAAPTAYTCPMHPTVIRAEEGKCPECGMKLMPMPHAYICPMHLDVVSEVPGKCPQCGMKLLPAAVVAATASEGHEHGGGHGHAHESAGGIEWEDDMVELNRTTTPANTRWKLVDRSTGAANEEIDWKFNVGDRVKIRLVNEMGSDHPMHHPFHIHGAGRFLVLAREGQPETNLVWKDTVLVKTGEVVDILLDVTHPGRWMAHCHIAETGCGHHGRGRRPRRSRTAAARQLRARAHGHRADTDDADGHDCP
jgi:Multicopper oxidase/Heavy metal binding domain